MTRSYEISHPWIKFEVNLKKAGHGLWMLLGEAKSKCEHIANTPLIPRGARELYQLYLAKGVAATTAIEGNTLTEAQVRQNIEGKLKLPESQQYLKQEIDNVLTAYKLITRDANRHQLRPVTPRTICIYNKLVLRDLQLEDGVIPGEITHGVAVGGYRGAPREDCQYLLGRLCDWLNGPELNHNSLSPLVNAIIKAIVAHIYIAWIHPFGDGNGRTARLLEFRLLLEAGVPSPAAHLFSNHYNQTRSEYYRQLAHSSKSGGDLCPFVTYAVQGFVDGLKDQLEVIRNQQLNLTWRMAIFIAFKDKNANNDIRRRTLMLEISEADAPVPIKGLADITTELTKEYATLSERTFWRDLEELERMKLLRFSTDRKYVSARKDRILGLLPDKRIDGVDVHVAPPDFMVGVEDLPLQKRDL